MLKKSLGIAALLLGAGYAAVAASQNVLEEWAKVQAPPPPQLKAVKIVPKETALLMLDFVKPICPPRPRCVATLPAVQKLLAQARQSGVQVIHSLAGQQVTDILPEVAAQPGEPYVSTGPNKFLNTELEKILGEKGIKTVIVVGVAAEGAVLNTGGHAALRGMKVIVPVDGLSSSTAYAEQYSIWHLANAPRIGPQTTLTRSDMIAF